LDRSNLPVRYICS